MRSAATLTERPQPRATGGIDPERVGDEHVPEARVGEDLGLGDGGDGYADCAGAGLAGGDLAALVGLDVWPERHAPIACQLRHRLHVPVEHAEIDGEIRRGPGKRLVGHRTSFHGTRA